MICPRRLVRTPPATTALFAGGGLVSGAASWTRLPLPIAAVQMIDTSIVSVHRHGACTTGTSAN